MESKASKDKDSTDRKPSVGKSNQKEYEVTIGNKDAEKPIPKGSDQWKNQRKE